MPGGRARVVTPPKPMRARRPGVDEGDAQPPLVLVVDDFPDGRELATEMLAFAGFRVAEAADGFAALELADRLLPAAILMDIALPGIDGLEVVRRLRLDERTRHIPVVALTAHALKSHADLAQAAGCDGFLTKPCAPKAVAAAVQGAIDAARARKPRG